MLPISANCFMTGNRPVCTAGQTTCGVAASMTTRRTFRFTQQFYCGNFWSDADITYAEANIHALNFVIDPAPRDDEQLMLDVQAGKADAAERLFAAYRDPLWRFFCRRVRPVERAEELTQDVFGAVLAAAPRYRSRGAFRSYLFGIAYNVLMADRKSVV